MIKLAPWSEPPTIYYHCLKNLIAENLFAKGQAKVFIYLINSECNFNWPVLINFCHDILGIRVDRICSDTIVLWSLPKLVPIYTLFNTLWSSVCWLTTRMRTTNFIKVWVTLAHVIKNTDHKKEPRILFSKREWKFVTSSVTTPWWAKYIHAEKGVPPAQPAPQRRPQHARMSLTERDTFCI
jgi:hypothetical protein